MALGGQYFQEGLPERKLESVHLPTVSNEEPAHCGSIAGGKESSSWPLGVLRRHILHASSSAVAPKLQKTLENAALQKILVQKNKTSGGTNPVPGS